MTPAFNTYGLCRQCLELRPATRTHTGVSVLLTTYCSEHGIQTAVREPSLDFYRWQLQFGRDAYQKHAPEDRSVSINVTDRCNTRCRNCYHSPGEGVDPSIEEIVEFSKRLPKKKVNFLGAEPTMRDDLPELIAKVIEGTGKRVSFYTNGLRLQDRAFVKALRASGVDGVGISSHFPEYVGATSYAERLGGLQVAREEALPVWCVSYTITKLDDVSRMIDAAQALEIGSEWKVPVIAVRTSGEIGPDKGTKLALSDLCRALVVEFTKRGIPYSVKPYSGPFFVILNAMGVDFHAVRMLSVDEYDHADAESWPSLAAFAPKFDVLNGLLQIHRFARYRMDKGAPLSKGVHEHV